MKKELTSEQLRSMLNVKRLVQGSKITEGLNGEMDEHDCTANTEGYCIACTDREVV